MRWLGAWQNFGCRSMLHSSHAIGYLNIYPAATPTPQAVPFYLRMPLLVVTQSVISLIVEKSVPWITHSECCSWLSSNSRTIRRVRKASWSQFRGPRSHPRFCSQIHMCALREKRFHRIAGWATLSSIQNKKKLTFDPCHQPQAPLTCTSREHCIRSSFGRELHCLHFLCHRQQTLVEIPKMDIFLPLEWQRSQTKSAVN